MTLPIQKSNFVVIFSGVKITLLAVSKLLITNYFLNVTHRKGADHKNFCS